jgi:protein-export membrane protein SecD
MLYFKSWKVVAILLISLASILIPLPNAFAPKHLETLPHWMQKRMPLGLDLQGGAYLLLQMDTKDLQKKTLENLAGEVRLLLRKEKVEFTVQVIANQDVEKEEVRVTVLKEGQLEKTSTALGTLTRPSLFGGAPDLEISQNGNAFSLKPSAAAMKKRVTEALASAIEVVRLRVDPLGTKEMLIQRHGNDRILIEVPGVKDTNELKALVGQTANLTFQLMDHSMSPLEAQKKGIPSGSALYEQAENGKTGEADNEKLYLLQKNTIVTGADLASASLDYDQNREPAVAFRFNPSGAQRFGKVTQENKNKRFAILLDGKVISAPVIKTAILGGSGIISGNFSVESATRLAVLLSSGALPARLETVEERTVGASLGGDAIKSGGNAMIIAFFAVSAFMILGYGLFGAFSIVALIVNVGMIMAVLTLIQATLTLPGIAGMALTMGVAVDANVLIFERMREELRNGRSNIMALEAGFKQAYATIIDSHLTGLLGGIILLWLGVGPIRGFAVTLCIGIIASLFTAITLTRLIIAVWLRWARPAVIPL